MEKYYKQVVSGIESRAPWLSHNRRHIISAKEKGKLVPGELRVKFDANDDPNSPLYKDAEVL